MPFMILCAVAAFIVQLVILFHLHGRYRSLRYVSLLLMECLPLGGTLYDAVKRPSLPYLDWEFHAALCLWVAGAVLLGYLLAWGVYALEKD